MNKYLKIIIYTLGFIIFISLAVFGYNYLSDSYLLEDGNMNDVDEDIPTQVQNSHTTNTIVVQEDVKENLEKAADFEVLNNEGAKVKLSDFFGKPIVVNFWATWCGLCQEEIPEFQEVYNTYNGQIEFLMVNLTDGYGDTVEGVKKFVQDNTYTFPLYFDTEYSAANAYGIYSVPQTLFIDADGNIVKLYIGMINTRTLEKYIKDLL